MSDQINLGSLGFWRHGLCWTSGIKVVIFNSPFKSPSATVFCCEAPEKNGFAGYETSPTLHQLVITTDFFFLWTPPLNRCHPLCLKLLNWLLSVSAPPRAAQVFCHYGELTLSSSNDRLQRRTKAGETLWTDMVFVPPRHLKSAITNVSHC